ncbi:MAG: hypothetical protein ACYS8Z_03890 [Planctomycetota bacterium]|jgi:hypothetical protein
MSLRSLWIVVLIVATNGLSGSSDRSTAASDNSNEKEAVHSFRAGASTGNITPPLDKPIVGGWGSPIAKHIHDELYARCLVLDDGDTKLVFVLVDSLGLPREAFDAAKRIIREKTAIPEENMMMAATHTHSSISARGPNKVKAAETLSDYQTFVISRIADGVRRALNNLQEARIGWGCVDEPTQVFNRRYFMKPGTPIPNPFGGTDKVVMNPGRGNSKILKAAGPTDPQVVFLSVQSNDGRPIALLANYSLHYVGPGVASVISADYFGVFADRIGKLLGVDTLDPPFIGMLSNGTSGDINNINWLEKPRKRWPPYEKMRQVAEKVAEAVHAAHKNIKFHDRVELDVRQRELSLAVRKPSEAQLAYAQKILNKPEDAPMYHKRERVYANRVMNLKDSPETISIVLQTFRIGDLGVCAIPFEVFVEIGLEVKRKSPFDPAFTISHANGSYGYLPTPRQHELGGYETWLGTSRVEFEASDKILKNILAMFNQMRSVQRQAGR